jgi:hypothetical protein
MAFGISAKAARNVVREIQIFLDEHGRAPESAD